jgi:hypothetical protein
MLRKEQLKRSDHALALIMAVLTQWTTHYLSMSRLLKLSKFLHTLVDFEYDALVETAGVKDRAPERAKKILDIVKDTHFWENLARLVSIKCTTSM